MNTEAKSFFLNRMEQNRTKYKIEFSYYEKDYAPWPRRIYSRDEGWFNVKKLINVNSLYSMSKEEKLHNHISQCRKGT